MTNDNNNQPFADIGTTEHDNVAASYVETDHDQHRRLHLDEWEGFDYTPLETAPVLTINHTDEFRHVFGLLYAIRKTKERSQRVLHLTTRAIRLNAGNPTAWMVRREAVIAYAKEHTNAWSVELAFTAKVIAENRKNYQAWEHRRFAAETGKLLHTEFEFTEIVLSDDEKNYHAWSHRQWLVRDHDLTEGELESTQWFILTDIRNNSAWNHRWLVTGAIEGGRSESELKFALDIVERAPRNESVWNYIHALGKCGLDISAAKAKAIECLEVDAACVPARRFLIQNGTQAEATDVKQHCELLAGGVDPIRRKYWLMQAEAVTNPQTP